MAAIVMKNNLDVDGPVTPPTLEGQEVGGYQFCMYFNGDQEVAFANTWDELLNVLINGYSDMSEDDKIFHRIRLAQSACAMVQASILVDVTEGEVSAEEYAILTAPRGLPQPEANWWTSEVPLVAVETSYEPFTTVPRPASGLSAAADAPNLWWIRPSDEEEFLISLNEIGFIRLLVNIEPEI